MTKTLELGEVIFRARAAWHAGTDAMQLDDAIAQAVREFLLSDENVERVVQQLDRHPFMVAQHRIRDARAALEAVLSMKPENVNTSGGRVDTIQKGE